MLFLFLIGFPKGLLWRSNETQHMVRRCVCMLSCLVVFDSVWPNGLQPARVLCPWGFSRQEYWSGLPCPSPGDLPNPEIESRSPTLQEDCLLTEPPRKSVVKYQTSCHSDTRSEDGGKTLSLCPGWLRQRLVDRNLHAGSKWTQQRRYKAWREIGWGPKTRQAGGGECSSSSARWSSQEIQPSLICARGSESPGVIKQHHHRGQWQQLSFSQRHSIFSLSPNCPFFRLFPSLSPGYELFAGTSAVGS